MNHYPRHIGDYLKKTLGLSMRQDGAYNRMMDLYYTEEKPLPLVRVDLYDSLRCRDKADRDAVEHCLRKFFTETSAGFVNDRCEEELTKYHERSESAKRSISARWDKRNTNELISNDERNTNVSQSNAERNTSHKPVASSQEPITIKTKSTSGALKPNGSAASHAAAGQATRLSEDWRLPPDWKQWAIDAHALEPERVVRISLAFRDFWIGKPGSGGTKLNWQATWRNWVRKEVGDV